jgi:predicted transcriptional regulator
VVHHAFAQPGRFLTQVAQMPDGRSYFGIAGIDFTCANATVPIGAGCKICDRPACSQRAFPYLGAGVRVDEHASSNLPYPPAAD